MDFYKANMSILELLNTISDIKINWIQKYEPFQIQNEVIPQNYFDILEKNIINYKFKNK